MLKIMGERKIRVLQAIRQGKIGGGETHMLELVSRIDKEVFTPIVLSFTPGPMVEQIEKLGIPVHIIETEQGFNWKIWGKVRSFFKEQEIDIVHAHGTRANSNVFWAAGKLNLPLIYTIHGWSFHQDQKYLIRRLRELSEKFLTSRATSNVCVSNSNRLDGIERFGMKNSTVIYNGISTEKFDPQGNYSNIRKEFNIPPDKTLIGYIVRITVQKDPITLINAMKIVLDQTKDVMLLVVGEGDLKEKVIQMVNDSGLSSNVLFDNFRLDVPDILKAIDIYSLPSLWEGLPIGILEAMSMGKVIIASPIDGTKEIITNYENGILVPQQNPELLAKAILEVHGNKNLQMKLAKNAINTIHEKFTVNEMVKKIENHYKSIIKCNENRHRNSTTVP